MQRPPARSKTTKATRKTVRVNVQLGQVSAAGWRIPFIAGRFKPRCRVSRLVLELPHAGRRHTTAVRSAQVARADRRFAGRGLQPPVRTFPRWRFQPVRSCSWIFSGRGGTCSPGGQCRRVCSTGPASLALPAATGRPLPVAGIPAPPAFATWPCQILRPAAACPEAAGALRGRTGGTGLPPGRASRSRHFGSASSKPALPRKKQDGFWIDRRRADDRRFRLPSSPLFTTARGDIGCPDRKHKRSVSTSWQSRACRRATGQQLGDDEPPAVGAVARVPRSAGAVRRRAER